MIGYCSNTNNKFYFDVEDYDLIKPYHWWKGVKGEVITKTNDGKTLLLHR
jgi:hypothetical protein